MNETDLMQAVRSWIEDDPDPTTRAELQTLLDAGDTAELTERFRARLEFGTAGLRGLLGGGPNRMNRAVIRRVTAGLAGYLLETIPEVRERGVVVGRDARRLSPELAEDTASVLAAAGIPVHVFAEVAPTPLVAFAVTHLDAAAGIVVTASHNPPAYNGYKVYWENGAQIIPPHDKGISAAIDRVESASSVALMPIEEGLATGRVRAVAEAVGEAYLAGVLALQCQPRSTGSVRIVYTPMHGVGGRWVREALTRAGFEHFWMVPEQAAPDGEFPTVEFPNPEEPGAMDLALALGREKEADLILANDPDADRLAVILRDDAGEYRALTGNEIGILLGHYLLSENAPDGDLIVMSTIVSSTLLSKVAKRLGVDYAETLTGFKWIANKAIARKRERRQTFVFGFEEALGYTVGELVRDKDGLGAALVFADLARFLEAHGETVLDQLDGIYREYGVHVTAQHSETLPGAQGMATIRTIMESFRQQPPAAIGGDPILVFSDVLEGTRIVRATGESSRLDLPPSNVLVFELSRESRVILRPSGTEPKIKYYFETVEATGDDENLSAARGRAEARLQALRRAFIQEAERRSA